MNSRAQTFLKSKVSKVAVIGAGSAGITLTAYLPKLCNVTFNEIKLYESNAFHYYAPNIDLIPFNIKTIDEIEKPLLRCVHELINLEFAEIVKIIPEKNTLITLDGKEYEYDYLLLSTGLKQHLNSIKGLKESLDNHDIPVVSTGTIEQSTKAQYHYNWPKSGNIIFYNAKRPKTYYSCINNAILYEDYIRKNKGKLIRNEAKISYISSEPNIFPDIRFDSKITDLLNKKDIETKTSMKLIEIIPDKQVAIFKNIKTGEIEEIIFDMLYVNPDTVQSDIVSKSGLEDLNGDLNVDGRYMVHKKHNNIFGFGHCVRYNDILYSPEFEISQSIVGLYNLQKKIAADAFSREPDFLDFKGRTKIPIFTGNNRCLEINYGGKRDGSIKESSLISYVKNIYLSQYLYFSFLTKGKWYGQNYGFTFPTKLSVSDNF